MQKILIACVSSNFTKLLMNVWIPQIKLLSLVFCENYLIWIIPKYNAFGGAEEDRTPDPLRARQVLSQLSYDPKFLLRLFSLLFVVFICSLSHILTYAPSFTHLDGLINKKILAKLFPAVFLQKIISSFRKQTVWAL